ncbi:MAG: transcriptional regulator, TetR family, partial [Blastococcus sp.]|nr:transcriptional regulator, TetR family [Blastococcus sp.]
MAHALPRTEPVPGHSDAVPSAGAASAPEVGTTGAVIRTMPTRPAVPARRNAPPQEPQQPTRPPAETPAETPAGGSKGGSGARERRYQETRARIVDAAADLFTERGFDSVSVMEIAKRAG